MTRGHPPDEVRPRWTDSLNLALITLTCQRPRTNPSVHARLAKARRSDDDPDDRVTYLSYLGLAWMTTFAACAVGGIGIAALLHRVDGESGKRIGVMLFVFVSVFCIVGTADAFWRICLASAARRRFCTQNRVTDDRTRRLLRLARVPDAQLLVQAAIAALFAWRVY